MEFDQADHASSLSHASILSPSVNQGLQFPAELHIDFAGANFEDNSESEFRMFDAVAFGIFFLH